jgi:hypothetical protein
MNYLLLLYGDEQMDVGRSQEAIDQEIEAYTIYTEELEKAGVLLGGEALHSTSTATTVRVPDGKAIVTHGPFAETKEQLGGYYLLKCETLDEALAWAAKCPAARVGSVEVRPIMDFSQA